MKLTNFPNRLDCLEFTSSSSSSSSSSPSSSSSSSASSSSSSLSSLPSSSSPSTSSFQTNRSLSSLCQFYSNKLTPDVFDRKQFTHFIVPFRSYEPIIFVLAILIVYALVFFIIFFVTFNQTSAFSSSSTCTNPNRMMPGLSAQWFKRDENTHQIFSRANTKVNLIGSTNCQILVARPSPFSIDDSLPEEEDEDDQFQTFV